MFSSLQLISAEIERQERAGEERSFNHAKDTVRTSRKRKIKSDMRKVLGENVTFEMPNVDWRYFAL